MIQLKMPEIVCEQRNCREIDTSQIQNVCHNSGISFGLRFRVRYTNRTPHRAGSQYFFCRPVCVLS